MVDLTAPYVTFTAEEAGSTIGFSKKSLSIKLEYSLDKETWQTMYSSTIVTLNNMGDQVYIRGEYNGGYTQTDLTNFAMTGKISASGNGNALWNYKDLNAPLKERCGQYLFRDCTSLTTAPELPATELSGSCYWSMFEGCKNLIATPALPAITLTGSCYRNMFYGCISLTTVTSLPATTLASYCYYKMFYGCKSLSSVPILPAAILENYCYYQMFRSCASLNKITCLATDNYANDCTYQWLSQVASSGTFIKHPDMTSWKRSVNGIPSAWTVEDAEL